MVGKEGEKRCPPFVPQDRPGRKLDTSLALPAKLSPLRNCCRSREPGAWGLTRALRQSRPLCTLIRSEGDDRDGPVCWTISFYMPPASPSQVENPAQPARLLGVTALSPC